MSPAASTGEVGLGWGPQPATLGDANHRRTAQAATEVAARVQRALEVLDEGIPEHLLLAGRLRMEHHQASLEELGQLADPPMSKDAIAGRIRSLLAMADKHDQPLAGAHTTGCVLTPDMATQQSTSS